MTDKDNFFKILLIIFIFKPIIFIFKALIASVKAFDIFGFGWSPDDFSLSQLLRYNIFWHYIGFFNNTTCPFQGFP